MKVIHLLLITALLASCSSKPSEEIVPQEQQNETPKQEEKPQEEHHEETACSCDTGTYILKGRNPYTQSEEFFKADEKEKFVKFVKIGTTDTLIWDSEHFNHIMQRK